MNHCQSLYPLTCIYIVTNITAKDNLILFIQLLQSKAAIISILMLAANGSGVFFGFFAFFILIWFFNNDIDIVDMTTILWQQYHIISVILLTFSTSFF